MKTIRKIILERKIKMKLLPIASVVGTLGFGESDSKKINPDVSNGNKKEVKKVSWIIWEVSKSYESLVQSKENWAKWHPDTPVEIENHYVDIHSGKTKGKSKIKYIPGYKKVNVVTITDFTEIEGYTLYVDP